MSEELQAVACLARLGLTETAALDTDRNGNGAAQVACANYHGLIDLVNKDLVMPRPLQRFRPQTPAANQTPALQSRSAGTALRGRWARRSLRRNDKDRRQAFLRSRPSRDPGTRCS